MVLHPRVSFLVCGGLLCFSICCSMLGAQTDVLRVSVKRVIDSTLGQGNGRFTTEADIESAFEVANEILFELGAPWQLSCCEIVSLVDVPEVLSFNDVRDPSGCGTSGFPTLDDFDIAAKSDPVTFHWRYEAVNVYVVNTACTTDGLVAGLAMFPLGTDAFRGGDIIALANLVNRVQSTYIGGNVLLHEIGHFLSLAHPAGPTGVAAFHDMFCNCNLPPDLEEFECPPGPYGGCCDDVVVANNLMFASGLIVPPEDVELSPCQLDNMNFELGLVGTGGDRGHVLHTDSLTEPCTLQALGWNRGDCDVDGSFTQADTLFLLIYLFISGSPPECQDACDANDDGKVNIEDPFFMINTLTTNGRLPAPFPVCGDDPSPDDLRCDLFLGCG